jgi:restriction endonuclease S subunit
VPSHRDKEIADSAVKAIGVDARYPVAIRALPKTWAIAYLGDVIGNIRSGFSSGIHNEAGLGIIHLRPMNISRLGQIDLSDVRYVITENDLRVQLGDILVNNTNSVELVGKTAPIIDAGRDCAFSNHMTRLRPPAGLSYRFIAYQLHYLWMTGYFRYRSTQHVNQASISARTLAQTVPLVLPPREEQDRIVTAIELQFALLEEAEASLFQAKSRFEDYTRATLRKACSGQLVPNEAELSKDQSQYESGDTVLHRILLENKPKSFKQRVSTQTLPPLPKGWVWARVDQVGEVRLGRQRAPQFHLGAHMRPYLRVANVLENKIDTSDVLQMNFTPKEFEVYQLKTGDILLNEGQSIELVGRPAMFRNEVPGACFQNTLLRFRAYPGVSSAYALLVFRHYFHSQRFQKAAKWSTNIAHLSAFRFAGIEFPLPPLAEQERIANEAEKDLSIAESESALVASAVERASQFRKIILSRAFSGKLVRQDPSESSANELLDVLRKQAKDDQETRRSTKRPTRKRKEMTKRHSLYDILTGAGRRVTPEELFQSSGIPEDLVDEFFQELKSEVLGGRVIEERSDDRKSVYLLAKTTRK